jgi:hypothetical protein
MTVTYDGSYESGLPRDDSAAGPPTPEGIAKALLALDVGVTSSARTI